MIERTEKRNAVASLLLRPNCERENSPETNPQLEENLAMPRTRERAAQDDYLALIKQFPLASIKGDKQLDAAIAMLDRLLAREPLAPGAEQYLGALTDLVEHYEEHHVTIKPATDGAMLQHLMDAKNISQAEIVKRTGIQKSTISEVLADKRTLSRANVQKVCEFLGVSTRLFADIKR